MGHRRQSYDRDGVKTSNMKHFYFVMIIQNVVLSMTDELMTWWVVIRAGIVRIAGGAGR